MLQEQKDKGIQCMVQEKNMKGKEEENWVRPYGYQSVPESLNASLAKVP